MGEAVPGALTEGGWQRRGPALWVWPPGAPAAVKLCTMTRAVRMDPGGPTVVGTILAGGRRWVLYAGRFAEVGSTATATS